MRRLAVGLLSPLLLLLQASCTAPAPSDITALVGATVIDGTGAAGIADAVVLIHQDTIVAVGPRTEMTIPADAAIVDLTGRWVVPGMIESNGHVVFDGQIDHAAYFAENHDRYFEIGVANLRTALEQGITAIRDTHGPTEALLQLREAVSTGEVSGSRLFTSGAILNYESLLDIPSERALDSADVAQARQHLDLFVDSEEQGRAIIADLAERGVDFIKISLSGRLPSGPRPHQLSDEVLAALLDEAQAHGLPTTSHTMNANDLGRAVTLGFDATEHPAFTLNLGRAVPIPDTLVDQMASAGVFSIPLLVAMEVYITFLENPGLLDDPAVVEAVPTSLLDDGRRWLENEASNPAILEARRARYAGVRDNLRRLIEAGAPIAMGTDKGTRLNYHEHANHVRELEIYVELGMTPLEAITSATLRGAELLGVADRLGSLEAGKHADLVVLRADPAADVRALGEVSMVFKGGVLEYDEN